MKHFLKQLSGVAPALLAIACTATGVFASVAAPSGSINGFNDPGGFTLNGNSGGPDNQSAQSHGVPRISGGTLTLTTSKGVADSFMSGGNTYSTFYGSENTSAYYNSPEYIGSFYASFVYHYNGSNPQSFGPGNGFTFMLQNDPRGLTALGGSANGDGQQGNPGTISPSAEVGFSLFTGFGQPSGTQLTFNGDPGTGGTILVPSPVSLDGNGSLSASDPISVILSYNGSVLSETLTDTITGQTFNTSYSTNLASALGSTVAYVGFTGGTGAAVADQSITNFVFSNTVPTTPVNNGPKLTVTGSVFSIVSLNNGYENVGVAVTTTNSGIMAAGQLQLTGVTLNGGVPLPPPRSASPVPTTPNLLAGMSSQTNDFVFTVPANTTAASLKVGGQYVYAPTNGTGVFSGSVRLTIPKVPSN